MIVFTGCTKHGREGRAGSVCLRSRFKYQQKWCHPTSPIQPLSKKKWKETWKNCLFLSEAVFVVEGVDSFVNCYHADCGSWVACDGEAECLPRHCGSSWVWNHLQLQQFWGKRKGFLFIIEKTLKPRLCFYKFKHSLIGVSFSSPSPYRCLWRPPRQSRRPPHLDRGGKP